MTRRRDSMKEIIRFKNLIAVKLPKKVSSVFINNVGCLRYTEKRGSLECSSVIEPERLGVFLEKGKSELLGTVGEVLLKEEVCKMFVRFTPESIPTFKNYESSMVEDQFGSAKESFESKMRVSGINESEWDEWFLIKVIQ